MAKKTTRARRAARGASRTRTSRTPARVSGFKAFALHSTEDAGKQAFAALRSDRPNFPAFAIAAAQPAQVDPESAAKRILQQALASPAVPSLTAPKVAGVDSEFKSLGVETVPLTGTSVVKFRQQVRGIPVYGS